MADLRMVVKDKLVKEKAERLNYWPYYAPGYDLTGYSCPLFPRGLKSAKETSLIFFNDIGDYFVIESQSYPLTFFNTFRFEQELFSNSD